MQPVNIENPFVKEKTKCILCKYNIEPDYKNIRLLSQFQSRFTGRIYPRNITGLCKTRQEQVENEIMKAQQAGTFADLFNLCYKIIHGVTYEIFYNWIIKLNIKFLFSGLMGVYTKEVKFVKDPSLFDIENPFRPHKY